MTADEHVSPIDEVERWNDADADSVRLWGIHPCEPGWCAIYDVKDTTYSLPVVAWGQTNWGKVFAMTLDAVNGVLEVAANENGFVCLLRPDQEGAVADGLIKLHREELEKAGCTNDR